MLLRAMRGLLIWRVEFQGRILLGKHSFGDAIREHLLLQGRNAHLQDALPQQRELREKALSNHSLFRSEGDALHVALANNNPSDAASDARKIIRPSLGSQSGASLTSSPLSPGW